MRASNFPVLFFALLLPAALLTISYGNFETIRKQLSFNLSGPLALAVCVAFFSRVQLTAVQVQRMVITFLGPLTGALSICVFSLSTAENLTFTTESSKVASGGFGPNQVSSAFGFGVLVAFLLVAFVLAPKQRELKWLISGLAIWLAAQSALTFSRSGLYLAAGSAVVAACVGLRSARIRATLLAMAGLFYVVGDYVVAPRLDAFTGGMLSKRFADPTLTGRESIMRADLAIWMKHPLFGVGPGMARTHRAEYFRAIAAHTELTRLVAEHGLLGLAALGMLCVSGWQALRRTKSLRWKAVVASMLAFALLYMAGNAMRLVLPSFAFGLAFASFRDE